MLICIACAIICLIAIITLEEKYMFGENLKRLRKEKEMSQEDLAIQLNVVRQTISKWEKGYSLPDTDMLSKIAKIFNVSVNELLESNNHIENINDEPLKNLIELNQKLNELNNLKKKWIPILISSFCIVIVILLLVIIWEPWCNMWHEFGKNLYNIFNN